MQHVCLMDVQAFMYSIVRGISSLLPSSGSRDGTQFSRLTWHTSVSAAPSCQPTGYTFALTLFIWTLISSHSSCLNLALPSQFPSL